MNKRSPARSAPARAAVVALLLAGAHPAPAQDRGSITIRPVARVASTDPVTLADIASLDGPGAEALGGVVVLDAAEAAWRTLELGDIRAAIDAQADPVWGHLVLAGSACRVRATAPLAAIEPAPMSGEGVEAIPADPTIVRAFIERRLALALSCEPDDLRLEFDARDEDLLRTSAIGRTVDVQPTGFSARMPLRVEIFEGDRLIDSRALRVGVLVRREVLVTPVALSRGEVLRPDDLIREQRWLEPDVRPIAEPADLIVRARIAPGQVIEAKHVELPLLARRGQTITAHSVDGAVSLQIPARALEEGRAGDVVRCETIGPPSAARRGGSARQILVRLAAPGIGVVVTQDDDEDLATSPPAAIPESMP